MAAEVQRVFSKRAPDGAWEIPILGDIGFFGTNGEELIRELNAVKPEKVKFIIYSPGGAVYDAIAVAGYIRDKGIECFAEIYGVCASAATVFAALAGPKNTAIAPGSTFLVHMPYGGDQKLIDNATTFLVDLYVNAYGWSKSEASKHMQADEGRGIFWTAKEAKSMGIVSEIMDVAKVAARYELKPETNASTMKVKGKLVSGWDAVKAMVAGEVVEVEVDAAQVQAASAEELKAAQEAADQATKDRQEAEAKAKEATDAEAAAKAQLEELSAKLKAAEEARTTAEASVTEVTGKLTESEEKVKNLTDDVAKLRKLPTASSISLSAEGSAVEPGKAASEHPNVVALQNALRTK